MMIMIAISVAMIMFCTCWKYYNMRKMQTEAKIKEHHDFFSKKGKGGKEKNPVKLGTGEKKFFKDM